MLSLYADHALLANITQTSAYKLTLDLAPVGVKKFNAPMMLKALDAAGLDATFETYITFDYILINSYFLLDLWYVVDLSH